MSETRMAASGRIAAPAEKLFQIVSSPARHVEIDGSGMLVSSVDAGTTTKVGDTFDMNMDREPLGDFPEMGKYQVRNTVTQIVPNRLFEWGVGMVDGDSIGHVYGWELTPLSDTETEVTNYTDWSALPETMKSYWPIVPLHMLEESVEKLRRVATD
ncbi:MAG: polyketide cyclase [Acidimicrobiia bacterium]|nr:polyketide cyclase [Acidimicrobiia bacterium]